MKQAYVGIDWSDSHHDVYITNDSAEQLGSFVIPNSYSGLEHLKEHLVKLSFKPSDILVAVECYEGLLILSLLEEGYNVYPINPKAVNRYRDRYRMSSSKSDPKDTMVLANILRTDLHMHKPLSKQSVENAGLKHLTRAHKSLIHQKVALTNQLTNQLKNYYPIILQIFSRIDQKITLAFLKQYPTPGKASSARVEELQAFFRKEGYTHPHKVPFICEALQEPPLKAPKELVEVHQMIVLSLIAAIRCLLDQIELMEGQIAIKFSKSPHQEVFSSLPTGLVTAARLNGELGNDISRYPTPEYLQTDAGTAPIMRRSGKIAVVYFRRECNKHLRDAFQGLARDSAKKCTWARQYFKKQIELGHRPSRAYRALANRWVAIVWKMLQEGQLFSQARLEKL